MSERNSTIKAAWILGGIFAVEGCFVLPVFCRQPAALLRRLGFLAGPHTAAPAGWLLGVLVAAGYIWLGARLPAVRANLTRVSWLKLLSLGVAVVAGVLEEYWFRGGLMDWAAGKGWPVAAQVALSGLAFGLAHGVWGFFRGSFHTDAGATLATGLLGVGLAVVYAVGGRSLAPCVAAHFAINAFAEPGLVLAAVRGEMSAPRAPA